MEIVFMKSALILLLFCTSIFNDSVAQGLANSPASVLWKISRPGSTMTSYILGSVHTYGSAWVDSFPAIDSLVLKQDLFICENLLLIDTAKSRTFSKSIASPTVSAKKSFGKDVKLIRTHFLETSDLDIEKILDANNNQNSFLFSMYYILLYQLMEKRNLKMSTDFLPMDDVILRRAHLAGKQCIGLDETNSLGKMISSKKQMNSIKSTIIDLVKELEDVDISRKRNKEFLKYLKMVDEYNNAKFSYDGNQVSDKGVMIVSRNKSWIKSIPKYLFINSCFIVVGIMHLNGKEGLLNMLKERGFELTPIDL
ncbi:TraB/GumN family protein [Pedobacter agri]|nr:TraB/GumN family protein [Pedobacter agri]